MKVQNSDITFAVATTLVRAGYYFVMRNRLPGSALKAQMVAFGVSGILQIALPSVPNRRVYQVLPFAILSIGSYFGKVPLKTAALSTFLLGGVQVVGNHYRKASPFEKEYADLIERLKKAPSVTDEIVRVVVRLLKNPIITAQVPGNVNEYKTELFVALKEALESKTLNCSYEELEKVIPLVHNPVPIYLALHRINPTTDLRAKVYEHYEDYDESVGIRGLKFLLADPENRYKEDEKIKEWFGKATREKDYLLSVNEKVELFRLAGSKISMGFACSMLPGKEQENYWVFFTAIYDAGKDPIFFDPFISVDKSDKTIQAILDEMKSDRLIPYVSALLDKMTDDKKKQCD